jgi:hypothetical protein
MSRSHAPSDEEKAGDKGTRRLGRKAATAIASPLSSGRTKWVKKMMQQLDIPAPKYVPTASERREEVKQLAKDHVKYVAPTLLSNTNTGDIFGKKTKFDWQKSRKQIADDRVSAPTQKFQKWVDEEDEMTTWLIVPVSLKSINTGKLLIPVSKSSTRTQSSPSSRSWTLLWERTSALVRKS